MPLSPEGREGRGYRQRNLDTLYLVNVVAFCRGRDVEWVSLVRSHGEVADVTKYLPPRWSTTAIGKHHLCKTVGHSLTTYSCRHRAEA